MALDFHLLRTEADYEAALAEIDRLLDDEPSQGSPAGDRLEMLIMLISKYEDEHHPMPQGDPVDAIRFAMERKGLGQADLAQLLRSRSRASEILARKRDLTIEQIRLLWSEWGIPPAVLIGPATAVSPRAA